MAGQVAPINRARAIGRDRRTRRVTQERRDGRLLVMVNCPHSAPGPEHRALARCWAALGRGAACRCTTWQVAARAAWRTVGGCARRSDGFDARFDVALLDHHRGTIGQRVRVGHDHLVARVDRTVEDYRAFAIALAEADFAGLDSIVHHYKDLASTSPRHDRVIGNQQRLGAYASNAHLGEHPVAQGAVLLLGNNPDREGSTLRVGRRRDSGHYGWEQRARKGRDTERSALALLDLAD